MNENDSTSPEPSPTEGTDHLAEEFDPRSTSLPWNGSIWEKLRWFLLRLVALAGAAVLAVVLVTGVAGSYTSRPEFCRSCHNMEPYYVSWQHSSHKDVSCIKCHFPPGVGEKIRGKLLGLVQLAKYVTASAGSRPAAEIPDASCLRTGCHDMRLLSGKVDFHGVPFDHTPHLLELRRGKKLRCTTCHSQIVQGKHMTVTTATCFVCHFKGGVFNEGVGTCTRCHQIPDEEFDLGGGVTFHHDLAYEKGVDCENCHGDLIRGDGVVPKERCGVCHDREHDLDRFGDGEFIHETHVTNHKIECLECHLEIQHSLDTERIRHAASDCTSCHPSHHNEQVNMIQGVGGKTIDAQTSSMLVARITCPSCHQVKETSATGTILWKASTQTCTKCHDAAEADRFELYHETLRASLSGIEAGITSVRKALKSANLDADRSAAMAVELNDLEDDLNFLRIGNGIHNIHYASTLTRAVVESLSSMCVELEIDEPEITLPEATKTGE